MAAKGASPTPDLENHKETLICSQCSETFEHLQLLPCSHTFCFKCLEDLSSRHDVPSPTFPCPLCGKDVTVPAGGLAGFPDFYYQPDVVEYGVMCPTHPRQELDMYCVDCQLTLCLACVVTEHTQHATKDLSDAVNEARTQLSQCEPRLLRAASHMVQEVEAAKRERQTLQNKKAALERTIRKRHALVVALADKFRDDLLDTLSTECEEMASGLTKDLDYKQKNLDELRQLQQRLQEAIGSGEGSEVLAVAKEMRDGPGKSKASVTGTVASSKKSFICEPSELCKVTEEDVLQHLLRVFATVDKVWMLAVEQFRCGEDKDIEVFCICPGGDGVVSVSFAQYGMREGVPSAWFDEKGTCVKLGKANECKAAYKGRTDGHNIGVAQQKRYFQTYNKSQTDSHIRLQNTLKSKAYVQRDRVPSDGGSQLDARVDFTIKVGAHRAHDVDDSEQLLVVLEEPEAPETQRKVRLYRRPEEDAIAAYTPPSLACRPSDVCFYRLGGQEVLLVSDEGNDAIHVVNVQDGAMSFLRYLAPGCPLLVQPTALNTDTQGRLWVACRGGDIITMTPLG